MASTNKGISGVAVAAIAAGALLIWSGVQNQDLVTTLRAVAMGEAPEAGTQKGNKAFTPSGGPSDSESGEVPARGNPQIVQIAASYQGHPYVFGGGHGTVCPSGGMDCSGYASCVLNRAGVMSGTLTTDGFAHWGVSVPFSERAPGDILVWVGGVGGGHMGIAIDGDTMWHNPCTGCGGVQKASYSITRTGRKTIVRRAPRPQPDRG